MFLSLGYPGITVKTSTVRNHMSQSAMAERPARQKPQIGDTTATNDSGSNLSAPVSSTPSRPQRVERKGPLPPSVRV